VQRYRYIKKFKYKLNDELDSVLLEIGNNQSVQGVMHDTYGMRAES